MEASLISATLALLGAAVGSGITSITNWAISSHKDRLDMRREKVRKEAELRKASRQVGQDLMDGAIVANIRLAEQRWEMPDSKLKLELWEKHSELLSGELTDEKWLDVELAISAVQQLRRVVVAGVTHGVDELDADDRSIKGLLRDIEHGCRALNLFVHTPSWSAQASDARDPAARGQPGLELHRVGPVERAEDGRRSAGHERGGKPTSALGVRDGQARRAISSIIPALCRE